MNLLKDASFLLDLLQFLRKLITGKPQCNHVFSDKSVSTTISGELPVIETYRECTECKKRTKNN